MTEEKPYFYIEPLDGKYYGTIIKSSQGGMIEIWGANTTYEPSHRELGLYDDPSDFERCDMHYEDKGDLEVCRVIVKALNNHFGHEE